MKTITNIFKDANLTTESYTCAWIKLINLLEKNKN